MTLDLHLTICSIAKLNELFRFFFNLLNALISKLITAFPILIKIRQLK